MHYCAVTYEGEGHMYEEVIMPESGIIGVRERGGTEITA